LGVNWGKKKKKRVDRGGLAIVKPLKRQVKSSKQQGSADKGKKKKKTKARYKKEATDRGKRSFWVTRGGAPTEKGRQLREMWQK